MTRLPHKFFRCQHDDSFTLFSPQDGFESRGHYHTALSHWLNRGKIEEHLDWHSRPEQPSPFISVFDTEDDAYCRAKHHISRNRSDVFIAEIDTRTLERALLKIDFADKTVQLPIWRNHEGVTFISTQVVREYLGVSHRVGQLSE